MAPGHRATAYVEPCVHVILELPKWRHTGTQTSIARQTDDTEIVGAVLERGEAAESDDYSHIVQPYMFEPYLAMPDDVDSAIATDGAN